MITVNNLSLQYGKRVLFDEVNVKFTHGNCYGVIGANGSGKSTFLKILSGEIESTTGNIEFSPGERMSVLSQNHFAFEENTVIDTVMMGNKRLYDVMKEKDALYAKPDFSDADGMRVGDLESEFAEMNGWDAESDAATLLSNLGVKEDQHYKLMKELPSTDKIKVLLSQALFGNPDILILDEPTNDLDIVTLNILEEFLEGYQGCMLMVTHDRYFMDRLVDHVFVLDGTGTVKDIHGNYTDYRSIFEQGGKQQEIPKQIEEKVVAKQEPPAKKKNKLSFKEQHELDTIEKELAKLEEEKKKLIERMNDTTLSHDELAKAAIDYQKTEEKIDEKTMRWLELQE